MTYAELTELIDHVIESPDLYERIQRGRALRLKLAPLVCEQQPAAGKERPDV